jgi:alpha-galactosidase
MTLWSFVQSPLIIGADLTTLDSATTSVLTTQAVLDFSVDIASAWEALRVNGTDESYIVWQASSATNTNTVYVAVFNLLGGSQSVAVPWSLLGLASPPASGTDLWTSQPVTVGADAWEVTLPTHAPSLVAFQLRAAAAAVPLS